MLSATDLQRKQALRQKFLAQRRLFVQAQGPDLKEICQDVAELLSGLFKSPQGVAATYAALPDEVDPEGLQAHKPQWKFAYPKVEGQDLRFFVPNQPSEMVVGGFGIKEPVPARSQEVSLSQCAVVLVPGVAFDRQGARLGYGKGFYDRALVSTKALKVGIGFAVQVSSESLPVASTDVRMDWIVTEKFAIQTQGSASA